MKLHLSLILLSALLATASAKEGYYAYVETDAGMPAFITSTTSYKNLGAERYCAEDREIVPPSLDAGSDAYCFTNKTITHWFDFTATAFFNTADSYVQVFGNKLTATKGSIIMDGIQLSAADLVTPWDDAVDVNFGLPQIALNNVLFAHGDYSKLTSNYCTINNWRADNYTINFTESGGTFTSGTVTGNVVIDAAGPVKLDGLTISGTLSVKSTGAAYLSSKSGLSQLGQQGTLKLESKQQITLGEDPGIGEQIHVIEGNVDVTYTGEGAGPGAWDVDVKSKVDGSLTVTASKGRVNAGILSGTGNLEAKQIYLTSFSGSSLSMTAGDSVLLQGKTDATGTVTVAGGQQAEITFEGDLHAGDRVTLEGNTITGDDDKSLLSADSLVASAVGNISLAGGIQIAGGKKSTISSTGGSVIFQGATDKTSLKNADIHASTVTMKGMTADQVQITGAADTDSATVSYSDKLVLKNQSSIKGNVIGDNDACIIQVTDSRVDGVVSCAAELTLDKAIIEGAESIFKLASKGTSQISNQNEVTVNTLVLGGGTLTVGTEASHDNDLVMQNLTVAAGTILNANMVLKDAARVRFAADAVVTLGCTLTLMGDADIMLLNEPPLTIDDARTLVEGVDDVLLGNGQDVRQSWKQYADKDVWYTDLYEVRDAQGTMFYTTDSTTLGATLSQLSLVYDNATQDSQGAVIGRLVIMNMPEPATGTLGLLALAALAARRRRR